MANFYNALENDVTAIEFIENIKHRHQQEEIRMIKRILIEGVRKNILKFMTLHLPLSVLLYRYQKGWKCPWLLAITAEVNLEQSVDNIIEDTLLWCNETLITSEF